ncbi:hypothetical protein [Allorhizocola rhizosphaerae]|uniref:hypothetical protein n=1 Tax=Allorhizocola rhizosphaerae TaxID=1872709 RepID=UPI0013C2BCF9|nr:hypothetical protein [Allorhizocola rhizosphaerae]
MSYTRRLGALALLGAFVGLPLAAGPAVAQPDGAQVTFKGGGLGLLLCGSKPDVPAINVGAESKLRLTNELGLNATLTIDGSASTSVASGETIEVQFHRGPVSIGMEPDCALNLNQDFQELTVEVTPARAAAPAPIRTTPAAQQQKPNQPASGGQPSAAARPSGTPVAPGDVLLPEMTTMPDPSAAPGPFTSPVTVVSSNSAAARLASGAPVDKGPIGLLAIIATVCVVGVSAGAIRAIITQRATRAEFA